MIKPEKENAHLTIFCPNLFASFHILRPYLYFVSFRMTDKARPSRYNASMGLIGP